MCIHVSQHLLEDMGVNFEQLYITKPFGFKYQFAWWIDYLDTMIMQVQILKIHSGIHSVILQTTANVSKTSVRRSIHKSKLGFIH